MPEPVIIIQGGANISNKRWMFKTDKGTIDCIKAAATVGYKLLKSGGSALDAVEAGVCILEDSELFNAGRGSHLTTKHEIEMDASIMDGSDLSVGGVTCVTNVKNPVKLARAVMDKSSAILLAGEGAEEFAKEHLDKSAFAPKEYFVTPHAKVRLEEHTKEKMKGTTGIVTMTNVQQEEQKDTVGAVALDQHGNMAYATSTGGLVGKLPGRVGDSPIVGCGGFADNTTGATSTTGTGERIARVNLAKHISFLLEQGKSAQQASEEAVGYMVNKVGGSAGVVTVSPRGDVGVYFNSTGMVWALGKENTLTWGIKKGEVNEENFT